ncbi:MAG: hypothetical protein LBN95_12400 [Prevotellaceae bacterium]|jgi:hypothetical protein|nr:hypothetical protein [Prevotellaceae bacterium]
MKNLILILGLFMLVSCNPQEIKDPQRPDYLPQGWDTVPETFIKSYFCNLKEGNVRYISENNKTINFEFRSPAYIYTPPISFTGHGGENGESQTFYIDEMIDTWYWGETENAPYKDLEVSLNIGPNRNRLKWRCSYGYWNGNIDHESSANLSIAIPCNSETEMPLEPNKVFEYLTDTVYLKNSIFPGENVFVIVRGKGIVSFLDDEGVKWTLQE